MVAIVVSFRVLLTSVRDVSTVGVPVTVTVSSAPETLRVGLRVTAWPTVRLIPSCTRVPNPCFVNVAV